MAWWDQNLKPVKKALPPYPHAKDHNWSSLEKAFERAYALGDSAGLDKAAKVWLFEIGWLRKKHEKREIQVGESEARMSWYRKDIEVRERWTKLHFKLLESLRRSSDVEF